MNDTPWVRKTNRILVCGFGVNDADYRVQWFVDGKKKKCPYYEKWHSMIVRAYSEKHRAANPHYTGVSVSEEWKYFSKFKSWMEEQSWRGLDLDKDILIPGNRVYSPETCVFVPKEINNLLTDRSNKRGEYPLGVHYRQKSVTMVNELAKPYAANINKGRMAKGSQGLGTYGTPREAHAAWQLAKSEVIQVAISSYAESPYFNTKVADALMNRAWKLLLDRELGVETLRV